MLRDPGQPCLEAVDLQLVVGNGVLVPAEHARVVHQQVKDGLKHLQHQGKAGCNYCHPSLPHYWVEQRCPS